MNTCKNELGFGGLVAFFILLVVIIIGVVGYFVLAGVSNENKSSPNGTSSSPLSPLAPTTSGQSPSNTQGLTPNVQNTPVNAAKPYQGEINYCTSTPAGC